MPRRHHRHARYQPTYPYSTYTPQADFIKPVRGFFFQQAGHSSSASDSVEWWSHQRVRRFRNFTGCSVNNAEQDTFFQLTSFSLKARYLLGVPRVFP
jgi:hypothetical protein